MEKLSAAGRKAWEESFFGGLPTRAQEALLDSAVEVEAEAGQVIYRELYRPTNAMVGLIAQGMFRVFVSSSGGREVTIRHARRAEPVGLPAAVAGGAPMGVQAILGGRIIRLQAATLAALARRDAAVGWAISQELTRVIFEGNDNLADNIFLSVDRRVAKALIEMAREVGGEQVVCTGQQEIADEIGSVREVVARSIRQLRERGLIRREQSGLVLCDPQALRDLVDQSAPPRESAALGWSARQRSPS